ncbi:MAG: flavorubredoxin [Sulfurimonas sp.]|jgi:flavorubredoxin
MDNREKILYNDGTHKCVMFSFDDESHEDSFLSVNQYLIVDNDSAILLDPGSEVIFNELYEAVSKHIKIENIKFIFLSHQDPDVSGSIAQWAASTNAKFIMSSLWTRFMSHYGFMDMARVMALSEHGAKLKFGEDYLKFISAHFLHSPGNFSLYDSKSKIIFSGDIGATIVNAPTDYKHVKDFELHIDFIHAFHKRYMGSNKVCRAWVSKVKKLDVDIIAPQHGLIFENEKATQFLEWFKELKCGSDYMDEIY